MKGRFLIGSRPSMLEGNVYANKSALVLAWILIEGIGRDFFSIQEVARELQISVGLVQKVFKMLVMKGYLKTEGLRTAKKFIVKNLQKLVEEWLEYYSIVRKCPMMTYSTGYRNRKELINALNNSKLRRDVVLALHSAAEVYGCKNTNLQTLELYLLNQEVREELEREFLLKPQERGYDVLLIEPYYKAMLNVHNRSIEEATGLLYSPVLLTFLDLYNFPLRGVEKAEFMLKRIPELKRLFNT